MLQFANKLSGNIIQTDIWEKKVNSSDKKKKRLKTFVLLVNNQPTA